MTVSVRPWPEIAAVLRYDDGISTPTFGDLDEAAVAGDALAAEVARLTDALKWIRMNAGLHYAGDAFEPEHMRELAELATSALNGEPVDDFDATIERGKAKAKEWMKLWSI